MTAAKHITPTEKSPVPVWLENTLLCIVLGLIVLRSMVIETPLIDQFQTRLMLSSEVVSLLISTALLVCIGLWLLVSILCGRFRWRKTGFGIAVGIFILAGVLSACFASNKRAAVTDLATLATPMLIGLFLVQLLTSAAKIRLALLLILAVGVAAAVQCVDQQMASNQTLIEDYEADPAAHLSKMGIEPDTMEHWMYEHRLYSKDIRGFLMTSNSTASFFLMAVFAALGLCLQAARQKMSQEAIAAVVCYVLALLIVLLGLFLTQSKGGIGAFILGTLLLIVLLAFGGTIWKYRRFFGVLLLLLIVIAGGFIIHYGVQNGRLPGGNSMLVRWQYWVSAVEMIRSRIATGVGGGNFPVFYTHYKIPAASETVQNPHNWILSLLSQYGPLGLGAFLAAVLLPFYTVCRRLYANNLLPDDAFPPKRNNVWIGMLVSASVMLLLVRPVLVDSEFLYQRVDVRSAAYLVLYLIPAAVFIGAFLLLRAASLGDASVNSRNDRLVAALMCGLVAVLIHNLIDFAIFEPGIFGIFWLMIAIMVAQTHNNKQQPQDAVMLDPPKRLGLFAGLVLVSVVYCAVVLLPPIRADHFFRWAVVEKTQGFELTDKAVAADTLSAKTPFRAANMLTQVFQSRGVNDQSFLDQAAKFADIAIQRSPADFKHWRLRAKINVIRSEQTEGKTKETSLQKAFDDLQQAIARYPGSGKLHSLLANVAEQLGRDDVALCHYQTAVDIEDAYREQFKIMYPDRETVISRLGETAYTDAKAKIEELQKQIEEK